MVTSPDLPFQTPKDIEKAIEALKHQIIEKELELERIKIEILKLEKESRALLIKDIADVDEKDSKGNSRLHNAVHLGNIEIAEVLLERGANTNIFDSEGRTPLHVSTAYNDLPLTKLLIAHGADVNITYTDKENTSNQTLLHLCTSVNSLEIVKELLEAGADIGAINSENETPLFIAIMGGYDEIALKIMDKLPKSHEEKKRIFQDSRLVGQKNPEILEAINTFVKSIEKPGLRNILTYYNRNPRKENLQDEGGDVQVKSDQDNYQEPEEDAQITDANRHKKSLEILIDNSYIQVESDENSDQEPKKDPQITGADRHKKNPEIPIDNSYIQVEDGQNNDKELEEGPKRTDMGSPRPSPENPRTSKNSFCHDYCATM